MSYAVASGPSDALLKAAALISKPDVEGFRTTPYRCPAGIWTIGIGTTSYPDGRAVTEADPACTLAQAQSWLAHHLAGCASSVRRLVTVPLNGNQFAALCSFVYNTGDGALAGSTLLRKLNQGDYMGAADEFLVWNKAKQSGVLVALDGLTKRRRYERDLFLTP